jgi:hypothetical protein
MAFDLSRRTPYDKWEETMANMDAIPLKPERKAQLEEYATRRGQEPAAALNDGLATYLETGSARTSQTPSRALVVVTTI